MPHAKLPDHRSVGSGEDDYIGVAVMLVTRPRPFVKNFFSQLLKATYEIWLKSQGAGTYYIVCP